MHERQITDLQGKVKVLLCMPMSRHSFIQMTFEFLLGVRDIKMIKIATVLKECYLEGETDINQ